MLRGHPWVFSNEIDTERSPIKLLEPGDPIELRSRKDALLGSGYINPQSLICVRLLSRRAEQVLDVELLQTRLAQALRLRERLFDAPYYRLVYGESDDLPGLVIDRFGEVLAVQIGTAGMERAREALLEVLESMLHPTAIVMCNNLSGRKLEGLNTEVEVARGTIPTDLVIQEHDTRFFVQPLEGQKTGWFFDQRPNRAALHRYCAGNRVLDVCCYTGGFGIQAAAAGATQVLCMDSSAKALKQVARNAELNALQSIVQTQQADVFDGLSELRAQKRRFDVVVLDPPALIPRRKDLKGGEEAYRRLNRLALSCLDQDGILISSSCSFHLPAPRLQGLINSAARTEGRRLQLLERGHQGPDHPIQIDMPESEYLKTFILRATRM